METDRENDDFRDGELDPAAEPTRRGRVRSWVHGRQHRLQEARNTSPTVSFAFDALSYDTDTGAPVLAAALGFRVFLFQVPYACLFVIVMGYVADVTGRPVTSFFHGRGIARLTANSVSAAADLSGWAAFTALVLVTYALFLSARSLLKVVNIVHALVWDVPRTRLASPNRAAMMFVGLITLLFAVAWGVAMLRQYSTIGGIVALIAFTIVPFGVWSYASWWLPHRDCPLIALAPGAALFAIGVEALHAFTVIWFPHYIESKSEVFGTIGAAVALLLWAYLLGRLITLAAVLNAALWARFGVDSAHPIQLRRPSWRVPVIDEKISRAWIAIFGADHETSDPSARDDGAADVP